MQALVRVQARILDQRMRLSHDGCTRKSTFSDTTSLIESLYLQDLSDRKSMQSREGCSIAEDWDERPHTIEEVKAMLQQRKDHAAALKREKHSSPSQGKVWRNGRSPSVGSEAEIQEKQPLWLDRLMMGSKPWDSNSRGSRASTDHRDPIKTVEIDSSSQPYSSRRLSTQSYHQRPSSPNRSYPTPPFHHQTPRAAVTPSSPSRSRPVQVRSASPRSCVRVEEDSRRSYASSQTPSLRSNYHYTGSLLNHHHHHQYGVVRNSNYPSAALTGASAGALPNYMAATESARARSRSQSAPRQRPSTPEREGGNRGGGGGSCAKKRLSFPVPDQCSLRSPSFKSVSSSAYYGGLEQLSNYSSCYTESVIGCGVGGGEVSPSSTSDLRRWLR
ncbi:Protein IQ-DOMAIN 17 [Linum grandiflorum]